MDINQSKKFYLDNQLELDLNSIVSMEWDWGFTGKIDLANNDDIVKEGTVAFEAPFEITDIWDGEIVSREGDKYVIRLLDTSKTTVTFNANKVDGQIVVPEPVPTTASAIPSNTSADDGSEVSTENPQADSGQFRYGEALQKTFLFYEANRSGALPDDNRIEWRSDSTTKDGSDVGLDLTGGYFDAGDHVKFNLPATAKSTMLAWGGIEYKEAYQQAGQFDELLEAVKWGTDYLLKSHISEGGKTKELYVQVGDGDADHAYWGKPEDITMARPSFKITPDKPGSDVAAGTAAALASASILFRGVDDVYADKLLKNAKQIFDFADTYRGKYSDSVPAANPFYTSVSGYADELADGAMWMYKATGEQKYLERAEAIFDNEVVDPSDWTWMTDNKSNSAALLLAQESDDPKYQQITENWLNSWAEGTGSIQYSPGGMAFRSGWGSLALSSSAAFLAELYHDTVKADAKYANFANEQINYILGDNPRNFSYMIGFGDNYPQEPHHRGSTGDKNYGQTYDHILYGALVGGPGSADDFDYNDDYNDWITNEVGISYNAPLTSALIQQYENFGGEPLTESELDALAGIDIPGI